MWAARATVEYSRTQSAPGALSQRTQTKFGDGQCQIDDMAGNRRVRESNKDKHQEGNLGQKDARLEKEKQSRLSKMGESSRDASHDRKDDF